MMIMEQSVLIKINDSIRIWGNFMITRDMIANGFARNLISIEDEFGGCIGVCCRIGDNAFYFLDVENSDLSVEEYWKLYTLDMTIDMLYNVLKDVESAEENGLDRIEFGYYESVLKYQ